MSIALIFIYIFDTIYSLLDNKRIYGVNYQGYPLRNFGPSNIYSQVTVDECQYLCEISGLCRFFNYIKKNDKLKDACFLKYGTGERVSLKSKIEEGRSFGHKYSSGI